jgi:ribosomal protein L40E
MPMRWLEDDLDDADGTQPYHEDGTYICRNCAAELPGRGSLCRACKARKEWRIRREDAQEKEYGTRE